MGVATVASFRTEPGGFDQHMALSFEALGHLRRMGMSAILLRSMAGADIGSIGTSINYASFADYTSAMQRVGADEEWQAFWSRAAGSGAATQIESSIFVDADPAFVPAADRPLGVLAAFQWRVKDGKSTEFMEHVATATPMMQGHGAATRTMQCQIGLFPMTVLTVSTFADLDAYGAYSDAIAADPNWQSFWAGVMAAPTADLIRSGLYLNISGD
jgi:hypothetical protein